MASNSKGSSSQSLVQALQALTAGATAGSPSTGASATLTDPTQFDYVPANELAPTATPAAWGIGDTSLHLFTGSTPSQMVTSRVKPNQVLGAIADHLGIKPTNKTSLADQVTKALVKQLGITGKPAGIQALTDISEKLGVNADIKGYGPWAGVAEKLGVHLVNTGAGPEKDQTMPITQVAGQFLNMTSSQLSALQQQLYDGGFYDQAVYDKGTSSTGASGKAPVYTPGHLDGYTMQAIGTMLSQAGGAYKAGKKVSWQQYLQDADQNVSDHGGIASILGTVPSSVDVATSGQLLSSLQSAFQQKLGRLPTQAELDAFTGQFDQMQQEHYDPTQAIGTDLSTGIPLIPNVPTASEGASAFAQSDQTEYLAHNMANAGALVLNAINRGGGLGTNPNVTSAA